MFLVDELFSINWGLAWSSAFMLTQPKSIYLLEG